MIRQLSVVTVLCMLLLTPATAQIPDTFENLKILDPEISKRELVGNVMRGFARGLGVRCLHCHVGTDGIRFTDVDFSDDAKETKRIARVMMVMTREINAKLKAETGRDPASLITVTCQTCHNTKNKPPNLPGELQATYDSDGPDALLSHYAELRDNYYGRGVYDFGDRTLTNLAAGIHTSGDTDGALTLLKANKGYFPKAHYTWFMESQIYDEAGNEKAAIKSAKKAIKLAPKNNSYKNFLKGLREK